MNRLRRISEILRDENVQGVTLFILFCTIMAALMGYSIFCSNRAIDNIEKYGYINYHKGGV